MLLDSPQLRALLSRLLPGLDISGTPSPSGQRVVYFCSFAASDEKDPIAPKDRVEWGAVVLKVSEGISATQIAYLEKEIHVLNSLKSPHFPKLLWSETFTEDPATGSKFLHRLFVTIEERVDAESLGSLRHRYRREREVILLLEALVSALRLLWLHKLRLVHRDLKPENILIRPNGEVVIIDLGILREEGTAGVTATGSPWGPCTPLYASPEQTRNEKHKISFRSDFFSLGVIAYELVLGTSPFGDVKSQRDEVFQKVQTLSVQPLHLCAGCSEKFSDLIAQMMEKEPYQRHRTVEQLTDHINSIKSP